MYIIFLPSSLMTENSFWISGQQLLTSELDKDALFNEWDAKDLLQTPDKAQIPIIHTRKRQRYWGRRSGCLCILFLLSMWERAVWSAIEIVSSVDLLGRYGNWSGSTVSEIMVLM
jgi:hypothetical protein